MSVLELNSDSVCRRLRETLVGWTPFKALTNRLRNPDWKLRLPVNAPRNFDPSA
jgi:hypothetical protein